MYKVRFVVLEENEVRRSFEYFMCEILGENPQNKSL